MTEYETNVWYGWNGGVCPVHPETVVEVQFDTDRDVEKAKHWEWQHQNEGTCSDIIAFRIIKEHKVPREVWMNLGRRIHFADTGKEWIECSPNSTGAVLFREVVE